MKRVLMGFVAGAVAMYAFLWWMDDSPEQRLVKSLDLDL